MRVAGTVPLLLALLLPFGGATQEPSDPVDYVRDILPILDHRCFKCHGPEKQKGKLRLDLREPSLTVIVPGDASRSKMVELLIAGEDERMPRDGEPLSKAQIRLIRTWIDQGAVRPADADLPDPRSDPHWAWTAPVRHAPPVVKNAAWVRTPIDAFIAADHGKRGLVPRPEAPKHRLLRRVTIDLTGLPPTREELRAFLADDSPEAYERAVDRLLRSPQYGERWGRHWMDVWRYSDWHGRRKVMDVRNSWPTIWRWRDWIIRSLNEDKGYDRMILEMLAADEVAPEDDETIVATGFIVRNWFNQNYNRWKRDLVEHTGKAFLGLTLNCALCHDHKYDPISQEEYFRFAAYFEPLELRRDRVASEPDPGPFMREAKGSRKPVKAGLIRVFDQTLDARTYIYLGGDDRARAEKPPVTPAPPAFLGGDLPEITPVDLPPVAYYPGLKAFVQREVLADREKAVADAKKALEKAADDPAAKARLATAKADLASARAGVAADNARYGKGASAVLARKAARVQRLAALCSAKEKLILEKRGLEAARKKGKPAKAIDQLEKACAAAESAVEAAAKAYETNGEDYKPLSPVYPRKSTGRRTALARWIGSRDNPLTARVAANHIWLRHFGRPLVESVFEFGRAGKKPTHPELLDWLAVELMDSGWKMKRLHKLIVTSGVYRMDSTPGESAALDSDNARYWRFPSRRVEAEVVRDAVLHLSGRLDLTIGGPELEGREQKDARRRAMYFSVYPEDGGHHPFLELFDPPDPNDSYARSASIMPQQALALTNSKLFIEESRVVARNLREEVGEKGFVAAAFEHVLSRRPTAAEEKRCRDFLKKQTELFRGEEHPERRAEEGLIRVLFNHNDFVTIR